jgi:hypothetical protein
LEGTIVEEAVGTHGGVQVGIDSGQLFPELEETLLEF